MCAKFKCTIMYNFWTSVQCFLKITVHWTNSRLVRMHFGMLDLKMNISMRFFFWGGIKIWIFFHLSFVIDILIKKAKSKIHHLSKPCGLITACSTPTLSYDNSVCQICVKEAVDLLPQTNDRFHNLSITVRELLMKSSGQLNNQTWCVYVTVKTRPYNKTLVANFHLWTHVLFLCFHAACEVCVGKLRFETILYILQALSRTTEPILGLFVLVWMHFSC